MKTTVSLIEMTEGIEDIPYEVVSSGPYQKPDENKTAWCDDFVRQYIYHPGERVMGPPPEIFMDNRA